MNNREEKIIVILKTKDNKDIDGFPKLWVRVYKNMANAERDTKLATDAAWKIWKVFKGKKLEGLNE